jgi:hypothetical protein
MTDEVINWYADVDWGISSLALCKEGNPHQRASLTSALVRSLASHCLRSSVSWPRRISATSTVL